MYVRSLPYSDGLSERSYLVVLHVFKWFTPKAPDLIQKCTKAPHITGSGELAKMQSLHTRIHCCIQAHS